MLSPRTLMQRAYRAQVEADREAVTSLYEGGQSLNALARQLGVSPDWLRKKLQGWGVHVRNQRQAFDMMRARRE